MKIIEVSGCNTCPYLSHNGVFAGAKPICDHPKAVAERLGRNGGLSKLRLLRHQYPKPPAWCPLSDKQETEHES